MAKIMHPCGVSLLLAVLETYMFKISQIKAGSYLNVTKMIGSSSPVVMN